MSAFLKILRKARLVVGGGQMADDTSLGWPVGWSSLFLFVNWVSGKKPLVTCIGAESLNRPLPRMLVKYIYSLARVCTCRDADSTEVLRRAGISKDKVWTTRDVVFSLDRALLPQWRASEAKSHPKVAMLIAYDPKRIREGTTRSIHLIDALLNVGISVQLVAHDLRTDYDPQRYPVCYHICIWRCWKTYYIIACVCSMSAECTPLFLPHSSILWPLHLAAKQGKPLLHYCLPHSRP